MLFCRYQGRICSCPRRSSCETRHINCLNKRSWHFQNDKSWLQNFLWLTFLRQTVIIFHFYAQRLTFLVVLRLTVNAIENLFLMSISSVSELETSLSLAGSDWDCFHLAVQRRWGEGGGVGGVIIRGKRLFQIRNPLPLFQIKYFHQVSHFSREEGRDLLFAEIRYLFKMSWFYRKLFLK